MVWIGLEIRQPDLSLDHLSTHRVKLKSDLIYPNLTQPGPTQEKKLALVEV